jgi:hypothetical protein
VDSSKPHSQDEEARWQAEAPTLESFVIRFWIHPPQEPDTTGLWRGMVTHVSDGKRIPIHDIGQIIPFIASYLEALNVRHGLRTRLICRLYRTRA